MVWYKPKGVIWVPVRKMVLSGLCAALLCLCGFLAVPIGGMVLTMQTFGVFFCLRLLGGRWGTVAVGVYLLLGVVGLPVFSAGQGGLSVLAGPTGGFLAGFLVASLIYRVIYHFTKKPMIACFAGLAGCYFTGALWYSILCRVPLLSALTVTVLPFILPDICKLLLAQLLAKRIAKRVADA